MDDLPPNSPARANALAFLQLAILAPEPCMTCARTGYVCRISLKKTGCALCQSRNKTALCEWNDSKGWFYTSKRYARLPHGIKRIDGNDANGHPIMSPMSSDYSDMEITVPLRPSSPVAEDRYRYDVLYNLSLEETYWTVKGDNASAGEANLQQLFYKLSWAGVLPSDVGFLPTREAVSAADMAAFKETLDAQDDVEMALV